MLNIGKKIKKYREEIGISQDRLSKLANVSANTIAKIEIEENPNPTIETLQKIAEALNIKVNDLIS